jgi:hypothetical protein
MACLLPSINWQARWWQPWQALGQRAEAAVQSGGSVFQALNECAAPSDIRFAPQSALPGCKAYEAFIFETKTVPTRDNLHDFFNGLAWLRFPRIKARLNALQNAQIQAQIQTQMQANGMQPLLKGVRGAVRDALTLFDENAAFLCANLHAPVIAALREHDWQTAFQTHRELLKAHPPLLFGHALLEKLVFPYKSIVAHVFPAVSAIENESTLARWDDASAIDAAVSQQLCIAALSPKPFAPLPVLGVPGWWAANSQADFYADRTVFRPRRT